MKGEKVTLRKMICGLALLMLVFGVSMLALNTKPAKAVLVDPKNLDFNHNGSIDVGDIAVVSSAFGSTPDPAITAADINGNGIIDILDIAKICKFFGTSVP